MIKQSDLYRQNADNCMQMAEAAKGEPAYNRYKRMEAAWLALAEEQDWLDGERSPGLLRACPDRNRTNLGSGLIKSTIQGLRPDRQRPSSFEPACRSALRYA